MAYPQVWASSGDLMHSDDHGVTTDRGFTGHEQLDAHFLTHMNGRVYDYRLGRFLSVDPIISNPANSQSINPYSYIGNNPLSGTDPTGYTEVAAGSSGGETANRADRARAEREVTRKTIFQQLREGLVSAKTSLYEISDNLGASLADVKSALAGAASEFKSALGLGNGGGSTTNQPNIAPINVGSQTQVATGNAQSTEGRVQKGVSAASGVGGGGVSGALAILVGVQADAQLVTDGRDSGLMLSVGARAGWNFAAGGSPSLLYAPSVPSLSEYLGADPGSFSVGFSPSVGLGAIAAGGSMSLVQYAPYCGSGPPSSSMVTPAYGLSLPGPGIDAGPYLAGSAYVYIPALKPEAVERSLRNWYPGF